MNGSVLVVGAGPAGMRASSELVNQGFKVFLVEEKPTIGGKMAQIDKMFPSNECSSCTIMPRMLEIANNPNINIIAFAEVDNITGKPGDFKVKVTKKPRYVDPMRCNACTDCFPVCPVGGVPMEYNLGRGASKAISFYSPFPPRKALIHPEKCTYLLSGKCGDQEQPPCVQACERRAIDFTQKPVTGELHVGAVIIATGSDELHTDRLAEYGIPVLGGKPDAGVYDAIVLAVNHDKFRALGAQGIAALGKEDCVIYDVKSMLEKADATARL